MIELRYVEIIGDRSANRDECQSARMSKITNTAKPGLAQDVS